MHHSRDDWANFYAVTFCCRRDLFTCPGDVVAYFQYYDGESKTYDGLYVVIWPLDEIVIAIDSSMKRWVYGAAISHVTANVASARPQQCYQPFVLNASRFVVGFIF